MKINQSSVCALKIEREVILNIVEKASEGVPEKSMSIVAWSKSMVERIPVAH